MYLHENVRTKSTVREKTDC